MQRGYMAQKFGKVERRKYKGRKRKGKREREGRSER